jgi:hypothetical protein
MLKAVFRGRGVQDIRVLNAQGHIWCGFYIAQNLGAEDIAIECNPRRVGYILQRSLGAEDVALGPRSAPVANLQKNKLLVLL